MGEAAFLQVRQLIPGIASVESRQPAGDGQKIHAVRVSESRLETIADAIHQRLQQCGGFMHHKTEAEARAALRASAAAGISPSYAIDNRELVEPVLARMGDKNIEQTILGLSAFPNR